MTPNVQTSPIPTVNAAHSGGRHGVRARMQKGAGGTEESFGDLLGNAGGSGTSKAAVAAAMETDSDTDKITRSPEDDPAAENFPADKANPATPAPVSLYQVTLPPTPEEAAKMKAAAEIDAQENGQAAAPTAGTPGVKVPLIRPHGPPVVEAEPRDDLTPKTLPPAIEPHGPPDQPGLEPVASAPGDDAAANPTKLPPVTGPGVSSNPNLQKAAVTGTPDQPTKPPLPLIEPHGPPVMPPDDPMSAAQPPGGQTAADVVVPPNAQAPVPTKLPPVAVENAKAASVYLSSNPSAGQTRPDPNPPIGDDYAPVLPTNPATIRSETVSNPLAGSVSAQGFPIWTATDQTFPDPGPVVGDTYAPVLPFGPATDRSLPSGSPPSGGADAAITRPNPVMDHPVPGPTPPVVRPGTGILPTDDPAARAAAPMEITTAWQAQSAAPVPAPKAATPSQPSTISASAPGQSASAISVGPIVAPPDDPTLAAPANFAPRQQAAEPSVTILNDKQQSQIANYERVMRNNQSGGTSVANEQADMTATLPEPTIDRSDLLRRGTGTSTGHVSGVPGADQVVAGMPTFQVGAAAPSVHAAQDTSAATATSSAGVMADRVEHILQTVLDAGIKAGTQTTGPMDLRVRLDGGANDVTVRIQMNDNRMHVTFQTDSTGLRQALESGWSDFTTHAARSAAVTVDPPAFNAATSGQTAGTGDFSQRQQNSPQQDARRSFESDAPAFESAPRPATTFTTTTPTARPASAPIQGSANRWNGWA